MILNEDLIPIGQIVKPHGIHGEMAFEFTSDVFDREKIPFFIFQLDGIFVPFRVAGYRLRSASTALLQLRGITTADKARSFNGLTIYVGSQYLETMDDEEVEVQYFEGFELVDLHHGSIGRVSEVDQTTENALFIIPKGDDELLIPVGDAYIVNIDHDKRIITVDLPEGLLEL